MPMEKNRCVMYFYSGQVSTEDASTILEGVLDPENDVLTEVGRHSLALTKALSDEVDHEETEDAAGEESPGLYASNR